jgi:hypothetical protein
MFFVNSVENSVLSVVNFTTKNTEKERKVHRVDLKQAENN